MGDPKYTFKDLENTDALKIIFGIDHEEKEIPESYEITVQAVNYTEWVKLVYREPAIVKMPDGSEKILVIRYKEEK